MYSFDRPSFRLVSGSLPKGVAGQNLDVTLNPNGELYGVPEETGEFTFTVRATFYGDENLYSEKTYTLRVADNSTANVWEINDYQENLTVNEKAVSGAAPAEYDVDAESALIIHSQAEFPEFVDRITVDGVELTKGEYSAGEGSIIATIRSQTLRDAPNGSTHTVSLENRVNKDMGAQMTRTSVNVTVKKTSNSGSGGISPGGSSSNNNSSNNGNSSNNSNSSNNGNSSNNSNSSNNGGSPNPPSPSKVNSYSVNVTQPANGSLTVNRKSAISGVTVTVTASPEENFILDSVTVTDSKGNQVKVKGSGETRTFTMPSRSVTVKAVFTRVYRVEAYQRDFGWLSASPDRNVRPGTPVTITTHPESGYRAVNIRAYDGNGDALTVTSKSDGTATFVMPSSGVNISADFEPIPPIENFTDLTPGDWFYADAEWALERGLMNGVTDTTWAPQDNISTATAVVTLARLQMHERIDDILKEFEDDMFDRPWLPRAPQDGQSTDINNWYWREARWAAASGILTENVFTGREPLSRAGFAVILRNYLRHRGVQVEVPALYDFSDSALIEASGAALGEDLNSAFQILREADVFRGDSTNAMLPNNNSTRAHMAALLHRFSNYVIEAETP